MLPVPEQLLTLRNKAVLAFLNGKSCHSDAIEPLDSILKSVEGVSFFCPDVNNFSYAIWFKGDRIIAYCEGMQEVGLRLSTADHAEVLSDGGRELKTVGAGWYALANNHPSIECWAHRAASNPSSLPW